MRLLVLAAAALLPACATLGPAEATPDCVAASDATNLSLQRFLEQPNRRVELRVFGVKADHGAVRATTVRGRTLDERAVCRALNRTSSEVVLYRVDDALIAVPHGSPHDPGLRPFILGHASQMSLLAHSLPGRRPTVPGLSYGADRSADVPGLVPLTVSSY